MGNFLRTKYLVDEDDRSGLGPLGQGDPNDVELREKEIFVYIPKYQLEAADRFKCLQLHQDYQNCADATYFPFIYCTEEHKSYRDCLQFWSTDQEYRKQITQEYLAVRSEYRRTGRNRLRRALKGETYVTESQLNWSQI